MIPRYQRILFWSLFAGIFLMSAFLLRGCQQAHKRLAALNDATPISAPTATSTEDVTLYLANDSDASITPTTESLALPQAPTLRARTLLDHLLSTYSLPTSKHPLQSGLAVDDVFLLGEPPNSPDKPSTSSAPAEANQLAIVNLRGSFVDNHPSGIQVEALTLQSIIGTLHAALPEITSIRFLVDGQPHDTLAGHADLLRTYSAVDTTVHPAPPTETPQL
jgi:sporulation and spore germination protein